MATAPQYGTRSYSGAAVDTTTAAYADSAATSISITDSTGWPASNFFAVINPGTATEEKVYVGARSGTTLTGLTRGVDDTSQYEHQAGETIRHCFTAQDAAEANAYTASLTTKGDLIVRGASAGPTRLAVGTDGYPLVADSTASAGIAWKQLGTAAYGDSTVTTAKLAGTVPVVPAGTIAMYCGTTAPTGWLLLDGSGVTDCDVTYPNLWAAVPAAWKDGSDLTLPDTRGKFPIGLHPSTAIYDAPGETGGAATVTLATANLPAHTHSIDHDHGSATSASGGAHVHEPGSLDYFTVQSPGGSQAITVQAGSYIVSGTTVEETSEAGAHTHTVDLANLTGTSGSTGSGDAFSIMPPFIAFCLMIAAY